MISDSDYPVVTPGVKVLIQLKSGRYYQLDDKGNRIGPDKFLPTPVTELIVQYPDQCFRKDWAEDYETVEDAMHTQTICPDCIDSWAMDYYVVLADNQPPNTGY